MQLAVFVASPGPALALMHGLHPRHRYGVTFLDELSGEMLRRRHVFGPRITISEARQGGLNGEVGRRDRVEILPVHGKRHGHAGSGPRTVGSYDGGAADTR